MHHTKISSLPSSKASAFSLPLLTDHSPRLSESTSAIKVVLPAAIDARVRAGDKFIEEVKCAKGEEFCDLAQVINSAPVPPNVHQDVKAKYIADLVKAVVYNRTDDLFHHANKSPLSPGDFVKHWLQLADKQASTNTFVLGMMYLDIAVSKNPSMLLNSRNAFRMIIAAFVVAIKMHEDHWYSDTMLSNIAGVSRDDMNSLVRGFLVAIDFRCLVNEDDYQAYEYRMMEEALGSKNGHSIYFQLLLDNVEGLKEAAERCEGRGKTPMTQFEFGWSSDDQMQAGLPQENQFSDTVSYIARILAEFNFPSMPLFPISEKEKYVVKMVLACYPQAAQSRFKTLQYLAGTQSRATSTCSTQATKCTFLSPLY